MEIDRNTIRQLREGLGLSQSQLAHKAGVAQQTVAAIEQGVARSPWPATVAKLAEALGVQVPDLAPKSDGGRSSPPGSAPTGPPAVAPTGESDA